MNVRGTDGTTIREVTTPELLDGFLAAPGLLNRPGTFEPSARTERALLTGTHPLSPSSTVRAWVAHRADRVVGRIALTTHPGDATGQVGFLAAEDETTAARLFDVAAQGAADAALTHLVGPVDGSFWLRYRLKVSGFDQRPYFGEPLNSPEQVRWWEQAGFGETDRYLSSYYRRAVPGESVPAFAQRFAAFTDEGFEFRTPTRAGWPRALDDLHLMLTELYADFPTYAPVDLATFRELFGPMKLIADLSVVCLAYRDDRPEGFLVAFPDYGLGLSGGRLTQLLTLARHRRRTSRYVVLYLGARHRGLGKALMHPVTTRIANRGASFVGALSHVGKPTGDYASEEIRGRSEYVLLRRDL